MDQINRCELLPGVRLTWLQTEKFKTDYISVNLLRPLTKEEAPFGALLPGVLMRGTEDCPDMQAICARLDTLYGAGMDAFSRKKGEVQALGIYMDFIDDLLSPDGSAVLKPAVEFMAQVLLHPVLEDGVFRKEYVESEKTNLINAIESQINDKRAWATKRMVETMFEGEAYQISRLGEAEQVRAIDEKALTDYWKHILAHSEIEIFAMGRMEKAALMEALQPLLKGLPRAETDPFGTELVMPNRPVRERSETLDVTQGKLVMGLRTPDIGSSEGYPELVMCNAILGGSVTSKLFQNVREAMSICYYASSGLEKFKGVMVVSAGVDCDKYEIAKEAILRELDDCRKGKITEDEIDAARKYLVTTLREAEDSPGRMDDYYLGQRLLGLEEPPNALIPKIEAVTIEGIVAAANRLQLDTIFFVKGETTDA